MSSCLEGAPFERLAKCRLPQWSHEMLQLQSASGWRP